MVEKVFHDFVKGLCFYYERRDPREEALELWFQQVKHIPDEPVGWMSGQIRGRHESYPRNLPLVMRELWQQWLEDHPQRRAHGTRARTALRRRRLLLEGDAPGRSGRRLAGRVSPGLCRAEGVVRRRESAALETADPHPVAGPLVPQATRRGAGEQVIASAPTDLT